MTTNFEEWAESMSDVMDRDLVAAWWPHLHWVYDEGFFRDNPGRRALLREAFPNESGIDDERPLLYVLVVAVTKTQRLRVPTQCLRDGEPTVLRIECADLNAERLAQGTLELILQERGGGVLDLMSEFPVDRVGEPPL